MSARPEREQVIHVDDLEWSGGGGSEPFAFRRKALASAAGGQRLGCSLYEVPPGKKAWPFHAHLANEEAIFVLAGEGRLRLRDGEVPLRAGSYAAFRVGEAHALLNTGETPLRYLCLSTMVEPDVTVYPDTGKVGVIAGAPPGGPKQDRTLAAFFRRGEHEVDYWEGER